MSQTQPRELTNRRLKPLVTAIHHDQRTNTSSLPVRGRLEVRDIVRGGGLSGAAPLGPSHADYSTCVWFISFQNGPDEDDSLAS